MENSKVSKALTDVILFFSTVFWQLFGAQQNATKTGTVALGQFLIYPTSQIILTIFEKLQIQICGKFVAMTSVDKNDVVVSKMLIKDVHGPLIMWLPEVSGTRSGHGPSDYSSVFQLALTFLRSGSETKSLVLLVYTDPDPYNSCWIQAHSCSTLDLTCLCLFAQPYVVTPLACSRPRLGLNRFSPQKAAFKCAILRLGFQKSSFLSIEERSPRIQSRTTLGTFWHFCFVAV